MDVNVFYQTMDDLFMNEEWDQIEPYLTASLEQAREEDDFKAYIAICNEMIGYYRSVARYEKGYQASEDVLLLMEELQMDGSEQFATVLLNSAATFCAGGRYRDAYEQYMRATNLYSTLIEPSDRRFIQLYSTMSMLLDALQEPVQAAQMARNALEVLRKQEVQTGAELSADRERKAEEAVLLTKLGLLEFKLNHMHEAQSLLTEAVSNFEATGAKNDAHYSGALAGLGEYYFHQGELGQALTYYDCACEEVKEHFGENESYAILSENCAAVCEQMKDAQKQQYYLERAKSVRG